MRRRLHSLFYIHCFKQILENEIRGESVKEEIP